MARPDIHTSVNSTQLVEYVNAQLNNFFPDGTDNKDVLGKNIDEAMDRMLYSLKHVKLQGYTAFNVLHSDLYAQFIYYLSNTIWINDANTNAAIKLFYLNKSLHGLNCMYDTRLPDIFLFIHSIGTMLGKADYQDFLVVCHKVTVGSDKGFSPKIGRGVYLGPGSSVIGKSEIGGFTHLTLNAVVLDQDTPGNCIAIGNSPDLKIRDLKRNLITENYFSI